MPKNYSIIEDPKSDFYMNMDEILKEANSLKIEKKKIVFYAEKFIELNGK